MKFCSAITLMTLGAASATTSEIAYKPADDLYVGGSNAYSRFVDHVTTLKKHANEAVTSEYTGLKDKFGRKSEDVADFFKRVKAKAKDADKPALLDLDTYSADASNYFSQLSTLGSSKKKAKKEEATDDAPVDPYSGVPETSFDDDQDDGVPHESWEDFIPASEDYDLPAGFEDEFMDKASVVKSLLPDNFSWRDHPLEGSVVTKNLNQHIPQYCGACWAHGSMSTLADRVKLGRAAIGGDAKAGPEINPSIQVMINCGKEEAGSCDGGSVLGAWQWTKEFGGANKGGA